MATLVTTDFTGANGASWPSPWTVVDGSGALQSGYGQIATATAEWTTAAMRANQSVAAGSVEAIVRTPSLANGVSCIDIRYDPATGNGYRLIIGWYYGGFELLRVDGWATTPIASATSIPWTANTDFRVRVEFDGTTLRAKYWRASDSEPGAWALTANDAAYGSGDICLRSNSNAGAASMTSLWDNVDISQSDQIGGSGAVITLENPTPSGQTAGYEHVHGKVNLRVNVSGASISRVRAYIGDPQNDGLLIGSTSSAPYVINWDTEESTNGLHQLYGEAIDVDGGVVLSQPVEVMVNNSGMWVPKGARAWPVTPQ